MRELPIAKTLAGVEMRLTAGGVRELHWHLPAEWAIMLYGHARITAVDQQGRSFVNDVSEGDLWLFPPGVSHSIQGLGPDGCPFLRGEFLHGVRARARPDLLEPHARVRRSPNSPARATTVLGLEPS